MLRLQINLTSHIQERMLLWGIYHLNLNGKQNRTPRLVCDSKAFAETAKGRFHRSVIAPYNPQKGELKRDNVLE